MTDFKWRHFQGDVILWAVRWYCRYPISYRDLEEMLADFTGFPRALLFSSGYMANAGVVSALVGRGDEIYSDKLNHASLNDAAMLSYAKWIRYPHLDLEILENRLSISQAKCKLVMTDAVFSMDGDIAPVVELLVLCEKVVSAPYINVVPPAVEVSSIITSSSSPSPTVMVSPALIASVSSTASRASGWPITVMVIVAVLVALFSSVTV